MSLDVQRVKRKQLAPYLRVLLPSWWLARFDSHADVATASRDAMAAAFPGNKQQEALLFCGSEVLVCKPSNVFVGLF